MVRPVQNGVGLRLPSEVDVALHVLASSSSGRLADQIRELRALSDAPLILASYGEPNGIAEAGLSVGAADVVVLPQSAETLLFALRKASLTQGGATSGGKIVTVFSPKGGSGKTVVATNIAVRSLDRASTRSWSISTCSSATPHWRLSVPPRATIADLAGSSGDIDTEKLKAFVCKEQRTGLSLLAAPKRPEEAQILGQAEVGAILDAARNAYPALVIDSGPLFDAAVLAALDRTDELLLVCNPEITSLKNVRIGLETIDRLGFSRDRVSIGANRLGAAGGVSRARDRAGARDGARVRASRRRGCADGDQSCHAGSSGRQGRQVRSSGLAACGDAVRRGTRPRTCTCSSALRSARSTMTRIDGNGFSQRGDASLLAERLQVDEGSLSAKARDPQAELKSKIHRACIARLGAAFLNLEGSDELGERVRQLVAEQLDAEETPFSPSERARLERQIADDILGYGPLEPFLHDPTVTEIMVNGYDQLYVERGGVIEETEASFLDDAHLLRIIERIVSQVGRRIDESSPMVDARLPDGSRVNAIIPPLVAATARR